MQDILSDKHEVKSSVVNAQDDEVKFMMEDFAERMMEPTVDQANKIIK